MVMMGKQTTVLAMQSENIIQLKMNSWFCRPEKMETLIRKQQQQQQQHYIYSDKYFFYIFL